MPAPAPAPPPPLPYSDYHRIKTVGSLTELATTPFADGVNAFVWPRLLPGAFGEIVAHLGGDAGDADDGLTVLDEPRLLDLPLGPSGRAAVAAMLADLAALQSLGRDPVLNAIHAYPRDEDPGPVPTDVYSFHADSAPVEADTWLCTYHGAPSEGLRNDEAIPRSDILETRAALLALHGGPDDDTFREFLRENSYDLHYAPTPGARPWSFGVGHLWRIAVDWPGSAVPPCIHRAPTTVAGQPPRLLLIC